MPKVRARTAYDEDAKVRALARVYELESQGHSGPRAAVSRELGIHASNFTLWVKSPRLVAAAKALNRASGQTQLSRPAPTSAVRGHTNGAAPVSATPSVLVKQARTIETVSAELAAAIARVAELKAELRALLD